MKRIVCNAMLLLTPISLSAAELAPAMLYPQGQAMLNGGVVPRTAAVFPGDLIQTEPGSTAHIQGTQGQVMVLADSQVKFDGSAVSLQHGSAAIASSSGMTARLTGNIVVAPDANVESKYQVSDRGGSVQIIARKGRLTVSDAKGSTLLPEGQQMTAYYQKQKGPPPAASGGRVLTPWIIGGAAAVGAVAIWLAARDSDSRPVSPAAP